MAFFVSKKKYVLFLGSRLGYEAIKIFLKTGIKDLLVFVEEEHKHESKRYFENTIAILEQNRIKHKTNLNNNNILKNIISYEPDYIISFGYRRMISNNIMEQARIAVLGTHFAPLPRYRGFAPLNWVLINGEKKTAVNLFYITNEVDAGDIIEQREILIEEFDDINSLYDKCLHTFKDILEKQIPNMENNMLQGIPQNHKNATYTCSRNPDDGLINWNDTSKNIYNLVRALTYPYPGAFTFLDGKKLFIWKCSIFNIPHYEGKIPGKVIQIRNGSVVVLTEDGALKIEKVQFEDDDIQDASNVVKSIRVTLG